MVEEVGKFHLVVTDTVGGLGMGGKGWVPEALHREPRTLLVGNCLWDYWREGSQNDPTILGSNWYNESAMT